eukprot:scaffold6230_cov127-Isochrysis_galbana.AAC.5
MAIVVFGTWVAVPTPVVPGTDEAESTPSTLVISRPTRLLMASEGTSGSSARPSINEQCASKSALDATNVDTPSDGWAFGTETFAGNRAKDHVTSSAPLLADRVGRAMPARS